jgi:hypothetical protein
MLPDFLEKPAGIYILPKFIASFVYNYQYCLSIQSYLIFSRSRGTEEYFNHLGSIDIINSTLGKALGGAAGGYTTGKKEIISLLRQKSRPYLFSNSLPPPVVASASKVKRYAISTCSSKN